MAQIPFMNTEFSVLAASALIFVALGLFVRRNAVPRTHGELGWFRVAAGVSMSFIGGAATIAMAGIGYANGLIGLVDPVVVVIGGVIVALAISKGLTPKNAQGISHFLANGSKARTLVYAASSLFVYVLLASAQIVALQKIFTPYIGHDVAAIFAMSLLLLIASYIYLGGISSVTRTDVVQLVVVFFLFLAPAFWGISSLSAVEASGTTWQSPLDLRTILLLSLSLVFVPLSQDIWIRVRSSKSKTDSSWGVIIGVLVYAIIVSTAVYIGHFAAIYGVEVDDPESVLSFFFTNELGLAGIVPALVLLAAIMSTLDSFLYNLTSTLKDDIIEPVFSDTPNSIAKRLSYLIIVSSVAFIAFFASSVLDLVLLALMLYVCVIGPGFAMNKFVRSDYVLWVPAGIVLCVIVTLRVFGVSMPFEPYSVLLGHLALIFLLHLVDLLGRGKVRKIDP